MAIDISDYPLPEDINDQNEKFEQFMEDVKFLTNSYGYRMGEFEINYQAFDDPLRFEKHVVRNLTVRIKA